MSENYCLSKEEEEEINKIINQSNNSYNLNYEYYDENFQAKEIDDIKELEIEIKEIKLSNSKRNQNIDIIENDFSTKNLIEPISKSKEENTTNVKENVISTVKNNISEITEHNLFNEISKYNLTQIENSTTVNKKPEDVKVETKGIIHSTSKNPSQSEEISFNTKHPNNNHFVNINQTNNIIEKNYLYVSNNTVKKPEDMITYSIEMSKARNKSTNLRLDNNIENSFVLNKLIETEKEYYELKYNIEQVFVANEIKLGHYEKTGDLQKYLDLLTEESLFLHKHFDKFQQIYRVTNISLPLNKSLKIKSAPKNLDKALNKYKTLHEDLSNRYSQITSDNYIGKLETILCEINQQINFFENENRIAKHSKKKSEIKFDKTQKILPSIDGKKIFNEYNSLFEQNSITNNQINKNKSIIKERDSNIAKLKEELDKLSVIHEYYCSNHNLKDDIDFSKNFEEYNKRLKTLEESRESLIKRNEMILLKNIDLIDTLKERKEEVNKYILEREIILNEVNENLKVLLEATKIRNTPKKGLLNKSKIDVHVQDKRERLDSIEEKDYDDKIRGNKDCKLFIEEDLLDMYLRENYKGYSDLFNNTVQTDGNYEGKNEINEEKNQRNEETKLNQNKIGNECVKMIERNFEMNNQPQNQEKIQVVEKNQNECVYENNNNYSNKLINNKNRNGEHVNSNNQTNYLNDEVNYLENSSKEQDKKNSIDKKNFTHQKPEKEIISEKDTKSLCDIDNFKKASENIDINLTETHDVLKEKFDQDSILTTLKELEKERTSEKNLIDDRNISQNDLKNKHMCKEESNLFKEIEMIKDIKEESNKDTNEEKNKIINDDINKIFDDSSIKDYEINNKVIEVKQTNLYKRDVTRKNQSNISNSKKEQENVPVFLRDLKTGYSNQEKASFSDTIVEQSSKENFSKKNEQTKSGLIFSDIFKEEIKIKESEKNDKKRKDFEDLFNSEPQPIYQLNQSNKFINFNNKVNKNIKVEEKIKTIDDLEDLII